MSRIRFISGLDLGQSQDHTALVIAEQTPAIDEFGADVSNYAVRHIERFALGTPYPEIVTTLRERFQGAPRGSGETNPLAGSDLIVDATGVGRPVVEMIEASGINAVVQAWTITAGNNVGDFTVPKKDLVGAVQSVLSRRRLKIAPALPQAATLAKELEAFRVKVTADRNETFSSWREKDHDDLVLALALAVWMGERLGPPVQIPPPTVMGLGLLRN